MLTILGDTFSHYQSPRQAVRYYLLSLAILAGILLILGAYMMGLRDFLSAMSQWHTWRIILPAAALILVDGVIGLYFFNGNPALQGARLQAAGDDAGDLMGLALFPTPLVIAAGYVILLGPSTTSMRSRPGFRNSARMDCVRPRCCMRLRISPSRR